jgi:hypothetical protein
MSFSCEHPMTMAAALRDENKESVSLVWAIAEAECGERESSYLVNPESTGWGRNRATNSSFSKPIPA